MSTINYSNIQQRVISALTFFGQRCTVDGKRSTVVFEEANKDDAPTATGSITGVSSGERVALLPGKGPVPAVDSIISCKSGDFVVLQVEVVQPAELPLLYTCRVRQ